MKRVFLSSFLILSTNLMASTTEEVLAPNIQNIEIDSISGTIEISSDTKNFKIVYTKKKASAFASFCRLKTEKIKDKILIKIENIKNGSDNCETDFKIFASKKHSFVLNLASGNVKFTGESPQLKADIASGNANVSGKLDKLMMDIGSGNLNSSIEEGKNVDVKIGSGNATVDVTSLAEKSNTVIHLGYGSARFSSKAVSKLGTLDCNVGNGSIGIALPATASVKISMDSGMGQKNSEITSNSASKFVVDANVGLGSVKISKN